MLILRRKEGESLVIGDHIELTVLSVDSGGVVSLGINAPRDILILRSELQEAVSANQASATVDCSNFVEDLEHVHADRKSVV